MRTFKAGEFKAKCLAILDEVAATGETVEITKRGRVVARLGPAREVKELFGRSRHLINLTDPNDDLTDTMSESDIAAWHTVDDDEPQMNEMQPRPEAKAARPTSRRRRNEA